MNYESQFIESQRKHAVSRTKMSAVRESATSLLFVDDLRHAYRIHPFTFLEGTFTFPEIMNWC